MGGRERHPPRALEVRFAEVSTTQLVGGRYMCLNDVGEAVEDVGCSRNNGNIEAHFGTQQARLLTFSPDSRWPHFQHSWGLLGFIGPFTQIHLTVISTIIGL